MSSAPARCRHRAPFALVLLALLSTWAAPCARASEANPLFDVSFSGFDPDINNSTGCNGLIDSQGNAELECKSQPQGKASSSLSQQCQTRVFSYNYGGLPIAPLSWIFNATSNTDNANLSFAWQLSAHHSWNEAKAGVDATSSGQLVKSLFPFEANIGRGGAFTKSGNGTLSVSANESFGFVVTGYHYDASFILHGSLTVYSTVRPTGPSSLSATFSSASKNGWFREPVWVTWLWIGPDEQYCKPSELCPQQGLISESQIVPCTHTVVWGPDQTKLELTQTAEVLVDRDPPLLDCGQEIEVKYSRSKAFVDVNVSLSLMDSLSGIDDETYLNGFELTSITPKIKPGDLKEFSSGFEVGKGVSSGKVRAWPTEEVYTLEFRTQDTAGNHATCKATIRIGPEGSRTALAASLGAIGSALLVLLLCVIIFFAWKRYSRGGRVILDIPDSILHSYRLSTLKVATNNFSSTATLGKGGFGTVYKGTLPDGSVVAVKKLNERTLDLGGEDGQDEKETDFQVELRVLGTIHHKNIVGLKGYCIEAGHFLLVYEFMRNGSLQDLLFGEEEPDVPLTWKTVQEITLGVARGLTYLHEGCTAKIIHRDIKPANILLGDDFEAKVGDFGLARTTQSTNTHISTQAAGTRGYLAPELMNGIVTEKADVFSFGVLMLAAMSGRKAVAFEARGSVDGSGSHEPVITVLTTLARQKYHQGLSMDILCPKYKHADPKQVHRFMSVALNCVRHEAANRPTMGHALQMLEGTLEVPSVPLTMMDTSIPFTDSDRSESFSTTLNIIGFSEPSTR